MGGRRRVEEPEDIKKFRKLTESISGARPIDISPFESEISKRLQSVAQETINRLQSIQQKRLEGLTHALMSSIGSLQYNPYAEKIKSAISSIEKQKVEPIEQAKADILSQYAKITPDVSKTLRMAGAYQAVPAIRERSSGYAQHIAEQFAPAYEASMKFLADTSDMMKNLGLSEDEIKQALTPYYTAMSEGERMAISFI